MPVSKGRQNLWFDADDTLWENNIYYEQVRDQFLELTDRLGVPRTTVQAKIDDQEQHNIKIYGYGSENFVRSLKETYTHYAGNADHARATLSLIDSMGEALSNYRIDLLPNVVPTLEALAMRHHCFLLTKGDEKEQRNKLAKSPLERFFERVEIVKEKTTETYEKLTQQFGLDKRVTWMIGNSPRSDINPSLAAGLGAVYIPHAVTWHFEKVPLMEGHPRLIQVEQFSDLLKHF